MLLPVSLEAAEALTQHSRTMGCAWCTGWEQKADEHLAAIDAYAGPTRPLAWIDDALDAPCHAWATSRSGPTLLVDVDPELGFTFAQASSIERWAASVG